MVKKHERLLVVMILTILAHTVPGCVGTEKSLESLMMEHIVSIPEGVTIPPALKSRLLQYWRAQAEGDYGVIYDIDKMTREFWLAEGIGGKKEFVGYQKGASCRKIQPRILLCNVQNDSRAGLELEYNLVTSGETEIVREEQVWARNWRGWYLEAFWPVSNAAETE